MHRVVAAAGLPTVAAALACPAYRNRVFIRVKPQHRSLLLSAQPVDCLSDGVSVGRPMFQQFFLPLSIRPPRPEVALRPIRGVRTRRTSLHGGNIRPDRMLQRTFRTICGHLGEIRVAARHVTRRRNIARPNRVAALGGERSSRRPPDPRGDRRAGEPGKDSIGRCARRLPAGFRFGWCGLRLGPACPSAGALHPAARSPSARARGRRRGPAGGHRGGCPARSVAGGSAGKGLESARPNATGGGSNGRGNAVPDGGLRAVDVRRVHLGAV